MQMGLVDDAVREFNESKKKLIRRINGMRETGRGVNRGERGPWTAGGGGGTARSRRAWEAVGPDQRRLGVRAAG